MRLLILAIGSWLQVFALNGGALIVLLGREDLAFEQIETAVQLFMLGLIGAFGAGLLLVMIAIGFAERAERRLDRYTPTDPKELHRSPIRMRMVLLAAACFLCSYVAFILGAKSVFDEIRRASEPAAAATTAPARP